MMFIVYIVIKLNAIKDQTNLKSCLLVIRPPREQTPDSKGCTAD